MTPSPTPETETATARPVHVLFMGRLQGPAGGAARAVPLVGSTPLSRFVAALTGADEELAAALAAPSVRVAVNADIVARGADPAILPGDEVAFMPPFSGG
jgi:molybdopterin converting factor small subunit